jgi:hypothetical protein
MAGAGGATMQKGVIYVAEGAGYLDLARASAESLAAQEPGLPLDLYTDRPAPDWPHGEVHPLPAFPGRPKIAAMAASRFARTLFLDCDTLVLRPLGDLFELLDRFELAVAHDMRRASPLIREGWRQATPYAFPQMNTGVLLYRDSPAMRGFLDAWMAAYASAGSPRDQVTFKDLLWSSDLRFYVLPPEFNLRRVTLLDAWEPLDAAPTILHSHRLLQHLRGKGGRVRDLAELLRLERAALAEEWAALGQEGAAPRPGEDPAARHLRAARAAATAPRGG